MKGNGEGEGENVFDVLVWRRSEVLNVDFKLAGQVYPCKVIVTLNEEALRLGESLFIVLFPEGLQTPGHRAFEIRNLDVLENMVVLFRSLVLLGPAGFQAWADFLSEIVRRSRPLLGLENETESA